jgi:hypothetical protein
VLLPGSRIRSVAGPEGSSVTRFVPRIRSAFALFLDLVITTYALALALIFVTGGVDLGVVSLNEAAKPLLVLIVIVPLRITLGEPSRLLPGPWPLFHRRLTLIHAAVRDRMPAAVVDVIFVVAAVRVATFSIAFLSDLLFTPYREHPFEMPFEQERFARTFAGWDSGWYFDIANRGYYFTTEGQSSIAFFPLYPMLMRVVAWPFGGTDKAIWVAGIVVSCAAFVLALMALHRFTQQVFGDREIARRTVLYLAIFPFSFFFTRVYAESILLLTSVLAVSSAQEGRWGRAGIWGALAALARPNGILIGLPLALMALRGRPTGLTVARRLAALLPVAAALAGYCAYVYTLAGDPLAWISAQAHWGYSLGHPPWEQLLKMIDRLTRYGLYDYFFVSSMAPYRLFHGIVALVFLALTPVIFKRLGVPLGSYVLASLLVPLSGSALEGVGRYASVLFPVFMLAASVKSTRLHEAILVIASLFLTLFVCLFGTGRPIY